MYARTSKHLYKFIEFVKEQEKSRLFLFFTVFFGTGIGAYLSLQNEPNYETTLIGFFITSLVLLLSYIKKPWIFYPAFFVFAFSFGFFIANSKAIYINAPTIKNDLGTIWLRGELEDIDNKDNHYRLLINNPDLWQPDKKKFSPEETPKKIRLNVRTKILENVNEGDIIKTKVILSAPIKYPAFPNGYDFAKYAYFNGIGAVGFTISDVEVFKEKETGFFRRIRNFINEKIDQAVENKDNAEILKALITAERGGISEDTKKSVRESGLGHILAISGMHMGIACIWFFIFIRTLLALSPAVALKYDTKKISSVAAIILGFFYLMITGLPVSATRAFIMICIFLLGVLINRTNQPLRPVAFAAFIILLFTPESLIAPGFQMSFAAVIFLIGFYNIIFKNQNLISYEKDMGLTKKFLLYFLGLSLTTILASVSTAPFAVYHFGKIPQYSLISNIIALPVLTFITLPFLFISVLLMPLGLEQLSLQIASVGVQKIVEISNYVSSIPGNLISKPALPDWFLWLASLSMIWLFVFKSKIRLISIPFILLTYLIIAFYDTKPVLIVDEDIKNFVIQNSAGELKFYGRKSKGYKLSRWAEELGMNTDNIPYASKEEKLYCTSKDCETKSIRIVEKFDLSYCNNYDFIIINGYENGFCKDSRTKVFNKYFLESHGTLIGFKDGSFTTSKLASGNRMWNR